MRSPESPYPCAAPQSLPERSTFQPNPLQSFADNESPPESHSSDQPAPHIRLHLPGSKASSPLPSQSRDTVSNTCSSCREIEAQNVHRWPLSEDFVPAN